MIFWNGSFQLLLLLFQTPFLVCSCPCSGSVPISVPLFGMCLPRCFHDVPNAGMHTKVHVGMGTETITHPPTPWRGGHKAATITSHYSQLHLLPTECGTWHSTPIDNNLLLRAHTNYVRQLQRTLARLLPMWPATQGRPGWDWWDSTCHTLPY